MITSTSSKSGKNSRFPAKKGENQKRNEQFVVEGMKMVSEVPQDRLVKS